MEDAVITEIIEDQGVKSWLFGVLDGHGGSTVAIFTKVLLPKIFKHKLRNTP